MWEDWEVGVHGIIINFEANGSDFNATYLPEVAAEQEWSINEAVDSLIRKSGYRGRIDDKLRRKIELTRYKSSKKEVSYNEYIVKYK